MKITYVANIRIPTDKAHGFQIMKMCEAFSELGNDIELIVPDRKNPSFKGVDPFEYYKVHRKFKITKIPVFDPLFLLHFPSGMYAKVQAFLFIRKLIPYIRKNVNDSVFYTRDILLIPFLEKWGNTVWECHSIPKRRSYFLKYVQNTLHIFTLTAKMKEIFISDGVPGLKISVSPDAVDVSVFDSVSDDKMLLRNALQLPENRTIIGYMGKFKTLGKDKGIIDLMKAVKILKNENSQKYSLCCVGATSDEIVEYTHIAEKIGLGSFDYMLIPFVEYENVAKYSKACDVLAMPFPNIEHYANFMSPLKMFEYMASKRPLIATDLPSVRDILNESNCIFCKPDDPEDIALQIQNLLIDTKRADTISKQAYADVHRYTWLERSKNIVKKISLK